MKIESKLKFLKSKGWHQWYNENYWVKEDLVEDGLDYTNYGFSLEEAFIIQKLNKNGEKIRNRFGLKELNRVDFLTRIGFKEAEGEKS